MDHPHIPGLSEWSPLARGGLAVVWEARQLLLDRLVAVKVYQGEVDERGRHRFLREAAAAGRLSDHPGIVTAYDVGRLPDDRPYLILELCPGGSLTQWLKPENRPSEERVRQVGIQIADALAAAHARGVLHRDIKPANILMGSFGRAELADFGLAAVAGVEAGPAEALLVTPAYAPPEAFELQPATQAGDVFSLAATLYALLKGSALRRVDAAPGGLEQLAEAAKTPVEPIGGVNWYLMEVLMTALSVDSAARPDAASFRDQLTNVPTPRVSKVGLPVGHRHEALSSNGGIGQRPVPPERQPVPAERTSTPTSRGRGKRRVAIVAVVAALAAVGASVTVRMVGQPASSNEVPAAIGESPTPSQLSSSASSSPPSLPGAAATSASKSGVDDSATPRSGQEGFIELRDFTDSAKPFQSVRISGTYHGHPDTFLQVMHKQGDKWLAFPIPTKTDKVSHFTAYVELGPPGRYQLRLLDPESGTKSKPFGVVIRA